MNNAVVEAKK